MAPALPLSRKPNNVSMELVLHNLDLVTKILLWVPAKSLVKFQSVCREWLSLISSTEFRQQHTIRCLQLQQPQLQSLILQTADLPRQWFHLNPSSRQITSLSISLPIDDDMNEVEHIILQSSNGLLLLQPSPCLKGEDYYLYVHNPATKQSRKIIPTPSTTHSHVLGVGLAFDPSKSPYYELVCFRASKDKVDPWAEVYSSKSHNWEELITLEQMQNSGITPYLGIGFTSMFRHRVRVYWNNAIYWTPERSSLPWYCSFNIAKREFTTPYLPGTDHGNEEKDNAYWCLQESNGHLFHVELMESEGGCETVAVWELDDDDDDHHHHHHHKWLLRHHLELTSTAPTGVRWDLHSTSFVYLVDACSLLICRDGWMRAYNLNTGSYEDFLDATGQPFFQGDSWFTGIQFGGTLALV